MATLGNFSGGLGFGAAFTLQDRFSATSKKIQKEMGTLSNKTDRVANKINASQKLMTSGMYMMGAGAVLAAPFIVGISKSMEFNAQMSDVYAKARIEDAATKQALKSTALELGTATKFTAKEAAEGMSFLAMAGFNANQQIQAMPGLLSLAAAGNTELALTADIVSDSLTAMGKTAAYTSTMADIMAATVTRSNTDITQMGDGLKYTTASAKLAGVEFEELSAMIGMVGDIGIKGSMAGTSLNMMFTKLTQLTTTKKGKGALATLGLAKKDIVDSNGNLRKMTELIPLLGSRLKNVGDGTLSEVIGTDKFGKEIKGNVEQMRILKDMFGLRGGKAFAAFITDGGKDFKDFVGTIKGDIGAADRIAEKMLDNLKGDFTKLGSIADTMFINIGDSAEGGLRPFVQGITAIVTGINKFVQTGFGKFIMNIVAALGALLIVGGLVTTMMGVMKYASAKLAGAFTKMVLPLLPFIIAATAVAAIFFTMKKAMTIFRTTATEDLGKKGGILGWLEKVGGLLVGVKELWTSWSSDTGKMNLSEGTMLKIDKLGLTETMENLGTWITRLRYFFKAMGETFNEVWEGIKKILIKFITAINPLSKSFEKWGKTLKKSETGLYKWAKAGKLIAKYIVRIIAVMVAWKILMISIKVITIAFRAAMVAKTVVLKLATAAQWLYNTALNANPIGAIILLLAGLAAAYVLLSGKMSKVTEEMRIQNEIQQETDFRYAQEISTLDVLYKKLQLTKEGTEERATAIDELVKSYGSYLPNLDKELRTIKGAEIAYRKLAKAIRKKIETQVKEEKLKQVVGRIQTLKEKQKEGPGAAAKAWAWVIGDATGGRAGHIKKTALKIHELDKVADKISDDLAGVGEVKIQADNTSPVQAPQNYFNMSAIHRASMYGSLQPTVISNNSTTEKNVSQKFYLDGDEISTKIMNKEQINNKRTSWE